MTAEKVIELGEGLDFEALISTDTLLYILIAAIVGSIMLFAIFADSAFGIIFSATILLLGFGFTWYAIPKNVSDRKEAIENIGKWKETIAYPYIRQLETQKRELDHVQIDPLARKSKTKGSMELLIVYIEDEEIVTERKEFDIVLASGKGVKPYMEYKLLDDDLGHGLKPGKYFITVYLPDDYDFGN